jgi:hypothetical protein
VGRVFAMQKGMFVILSFKFFLGLEGHGSFVNYM